MTVTVKRTDLSQYDTFQVYGPHGNRVTIAVRGQSHYPLDETRGHYSIHLIVWGDFGPWEHFWSHAGGPQEIWWNWLHDTDMNYWLKKVVGSYQEFDFEKSQKTVIKEILRLRKEGEINKRSAREAYDEMVELGVTQETHFLQVVCDLRFYSSHTGRSYPMFEEYWEWSYQRTKPDLVWFWNNIWRPFIEQAKRTEGFNQPDFGAPPS